MNVPSADPSRDAPLALGPAVSRRAPAAPPAPAAEELREPLAPFGAQGGPAAGGAEPVHSAEAAAPTPLEHRAAPPSAAEDLPWLMLDDPEPEAPSFAPQEPAVRSTDAGSDADASWLPAIDVALRDPWSNEPAAPVPPAAAQAPGTPAPPLADGPADERQEDEEDAWDIAHLLEATAPAAPVAEVPAAGEAPTSEQPPVVATQGFEAVADRLERIARALRAGNLGEVMHSDARDPLHLLIVGYALGFSEGERRARGEDAARAG